MRKALGAPRARLLRVSCAVHRDIAALRPLPALPGDPRGQSAGEGTDALEREAQGAAARVSSPASAFLQARANSPEELKCFRVAVVLRMLEDAKRMHKSGLWLSVEEIEAVCSHIPEAR